MSAPSPKKDRGESLFGRIALMKGLVREDQLQRALRLQEEIRALGLLKPLGAVLLMEGALTPDQVEQILRLQRINQQARRERRYGALAVSNGLITPAQMEEVLEESRQGDFRRPLGELLLARGWLEPTAVRALDQALERALHGDPDARGGPTGKLSRALSLAALDDEDPEREAAERRVQDVLFAALALREGLVLVPELERALRDQAAHPAPPALPQVLLERGILNATEVELVRGAVSKASQAEAIAIPGYEVLDVLGGGATSIVLRARQTLADREVALKILRTEPSGTRPEDLVAEARSIARVRHPNVVGLYDVGRVHRRIYYVMELVDGPTLLDVIRQQGPLPERRALEVGRDVARALEAVEAAGLVHRDVKPGNIVLTAAGGPAKLTDLGLAREAGGAREEDDALYGTPHTMSPEQANGDPVDIRSDLYGLGATLFHALAGQPPYDGQRPLEVLIAHVSAPIPDLLAIRPQLGVATATLVRRLLAKRPADRFPHAADAAAALEQALSALPA